MKSQAVARPALALFLVACVPAAARAEDVGAIVAALKDEASECRYYMQRCELARAARRQLTATLDSIHAKLSAATADYLQEQMMGAIATVGKYRNDVVTVHNVIAAKHDRPPACLGQCGDVLQP